MIKDINFEIIGSLIAQLRETNGLTQEELAKELHVSKSAICQWENGSGIKTDNLYDIAQYFNITVGELIEGQLNEEDEDYFERNYNLDEFEDFKEINEDNYDDLLEYLKRCKNVIKRFMHLFFLDRDNKLTKKQSDEYHKLSRYFYKDYEYADAVGLGSFTDSFNSVITELEETYGITDKQELDYILFKLYYLKTKVKTVDVLNYEKSDLAANEIMELNGKEFCDALLTNLVDGATDEDIEKSLAIKRLIKNGARCFFTRRHIGSFEYKEIDAETFKHLIGVVENAIIQDRYEFFKEEEKTNKVFEQYNPYSWKNYKKQAYEYLIDVETTNRVRDLVLLKNTDPKTYYKDLIERDAKKMEKQ